MPLLEPLTPLARTLPLHGAMSSGKGLAVEGSGEFVTLDFASLRREPLVGGEGTRYSLDLLGPVDGQWVRSFYALQESAEVFSPYQLNALGRTIYFDVSAGEDEDRVVLLIEFLVELVRSVEAVVPDA